MLRRFELNGLSIGDRLGGTIGYIILVTETHFKSRHDDTASHIDGYNCFRVDRLKRKGGGVCIYVKHSIRATHISLKHSLTNAEYVWVTFTVSDVTEVYLCCCYHPQAQLQQS